MPGHPMSVLFEKGDDGVAVVTLNRPEAMNALSAGLRNALFDALCAIRDDDAVRVAILIGAGDRAFSAGLDLKELQGDERHLRAAIGDDPRFNPVRAIAQCGKPVIAAVNGVAITGGFEVALACTLRIASTRARFADTHALVGLMPAWGLSQRLSRTVGLARAQEMSLSGRFIDAGTALNWGLVNHVVEPEALLTEARALAAQMASVEPGLASDYRRLIDEGHDLPLSEALGLEQQASARRNQGLPTRDDA